MQEIDIENKIYEIRGVQVMLDSDLAKLYECKNGTKEINQAVKNNPNKFSERYSWFLEKEEWNLLRSKVLTLEDNITGKGQYRKYLPRVFTEQGVYMLATILKTEVATEISIKIMDAFVKMRKYFRTNNEILKTKYEKQYNNVTFIYNNSIHDRFIILDKKELNIFT